MLQQRLSHTNHWWLQSLGGRQSLYMRGCLEGDGEAAAGTEMKEGFWSPEELQSVLFLPDVHTWYPHMPMASKAHFLRVKPCPGCPKT